VIEIDHLLSAEAVIERHAAALDPLTLAERHVMLKKLERPLAGLVVLICLTPLSLL
jgi:hypothetical protein